MDYYIYAVIMTKQKFKGSSYERRKISI